MISLPTGVFLDSFTVAAQYGRVKVLWETTSEVNVLGFNVQRMDETGQFVTINKDLIGARRSGAELGDLYDWIDDDVTPGERYTYRLELLMLDGRRDYYGPRSVLVPAHQLFVPRALH